MNRSRHGAPRRWLLLILALPSIYSLCTLPRHGRTGHGPPLTDSGLYALLVAQHALLVAVLYRACRRSKAEPPRCLVLELSRGPFYRAVARDFVAGISFSPAQIAREPFATTDWLLDQAPRQPWVSGLKSPTARSVPFRSGPVWPGSKPKRPSKRHNVTSRTALPTYETLCLFPYRHLGCVPLVSPYHYAAYSILLNLASN